MAPATTASPCSVILLVVGQLTLSELRLVVKQHSRLIRNFIQFINTQPMCQFAPNNNNNKYKLKYHLKISSDISDWQLCLQL